MQLKSISQSINNVFFFFKYQCFFSFSKECIHWTLNISVTKLVLIWPVRPYQYQLIHTRTSSFFNDCVWFWVWEMNMRRVNLNTPHKYKVLRLHGISKKMSYVKILVFIFIFLPWLSNGTQCLSVEFTTKYVNRFLGGVFLLISWGFFCIVLIFLFSCESFSSFIQLVIWKKIFLVFFFDSIALSNFH